MSHSVTIKVDGFKRADCLRDAFEALGWHTKLNAKIRTYASDPGRNRTFPLVARNPIGIYDVGVEEVDGKQGITADWMMMSMDAKKMLHSDDDLRSFARLKAEYSKQNAMRLAKSRGGTIAFSQGANGVTKAKLVLYV